MTHPTDGSIEDSGTPAIFSRRQIIFAPLASLAVAVLSDEIDAESVAATSEGDDPDGYGESDYGASYGS